MKTFLELTELAKNVLGITQRLRVDDAVVICAKLRENIVRFSNSSITIAEDLDNVIVNVYFAKNGKRTVGATSNINNQSLEKFVNSLEKSCMMQKKNQEYYTPLPKGPFVYSTVKTYDRKLAGLKDETTDIAQQVIDLSLRNGAMKVAGILTNAEEYIVISTTTGIDAVGSKTKILLNIRAFADRNATGQGLSCAGTIKDFNPEDAALTATEMAKNSVNSEGWDEGVYEVLLGSTVAADIVQLIGMSASAFHVDSGLSFLINKLDNKVASEYFTLHDLGAVEGCLDGRIFDDEGVPTQDTTIIEKGVLRGYLHNTATSKKWKTKSTGNAGWIIPQPWNLIVEPGSYEFDELVQNVKKGIYVTSNWYTRFQNYRNGDFSTVSRDATFLIENGKIKHSIKGARLSDNILRMMESVYALSKERRWIEWWEVSTPTLTPTMLAKDVKVTKT